MEIKTVKRNEANYPIKLLKIKDSPKELHYIGTLPDENKKCVAIVGARNCSEYGMEVARSVAKALAQNNIDIISGLALGIDTAATLGAIEGNGKVYEVLGSGVDVCSQTYNQKIYDKVIETGGGIISEQENGEPPLPINFPLRNRIISGFADIILVVEARGKSGSLITVDYGLDQGKTIFAVPGRIGDGLSKGTNNLIKQGAYILTSVDDILSYLGIVNSDNETPERKVNIDTLDYFEQLVYKTIGEESMHIDKISEKVKLPQTKLLNTLMSLELYGLIGTTITNVYTRL